MNKTKYYLSVVVIFLLLIPLESLKTADLCLKTKENKQNPFKCKGKFNYECNKEYCSVDEDACNDFTKLNIFLDTIKSVSTKRKIMKTMNTIKVCANRPNEWKQTDICLNTFNCYERKSLIHLLGKASANFIRHVTCPCNGNYKYKCRKQYCALNEETCDGFNSYLEDFNNDDVQSIRLYSCGKELNY